MMIFLAMVPHVSVSGVGFSFGVRQWLGTSSLPEVHLLVEVDFQDAIWGSTFLASPFPQRTTRNVVIFWN